MADEMADLSDAVTFGLDTASVCYLNAASRTPLPTRTLEIGLAAIKRKASTPWDIGDTEADKDRARELFASMLPGATADDIAMVPCCSYAMSLAAKNMRAVLRARPAHQRAVLVLHDQNPSNVMPWQQLCEEEAGTLLVVPAPAAGDWAQAVCKVLAGGNVAIAALPPCHWCDGALVDLESIGAACRAAGTVLIVDATQWIGGGPPIDVVALGISFLAASIHKWLMGPYGGCLCYASRSFWEVASPLEHHDRNREGAQHVECLPMGPDGFPTGFMDGARRLDGGGRPSYIVLPMLVCSLELLVHEIQIERLHKWLLRYTREIVRQAAALGFTAPSRHAPGIVGLRPGPGMPSAEVIVRQLKARRPRPVLVSERFGAIRIAPHIYNTTDDMRQLLDALREAVTAPLSSRL